ncbi:MAG: hypothetical protein EXS03_09730 [Phycisphaerales bacterium]|nr:hypothetical protein [Phycisphaerales bacterium]
MNCYTCTDFIARITVGAILAASATLEGAWADTGVIAHPALEQTASAASRQLGAFGESLVDAGLQARGFEVFNGNVGVNGIDRIAVKRAASGELTDIRFIEVKTRQAAADFSLAQTKNSGRQLSNEWIGNGLDLIIDGHDDPTLRSLAKETQGRLKATPSLLRRELHSIAVDSNKYIISSVDAVGAAEARVAARVVEVRLTDLLGELSKRGTTKSTRAVASQHLAQFDQLQTAGARSASRQAALAKVSSEGIDGLVTRAKLPLSRGTAAPRTVVVESATAARSSMIALARAPGVAATGLTFAVDEAFTAWDYYQGDINKAAFQRQTAQNGVKAVAVGAAIQLVYFLSATPHGLVVVGVGIAAYVAADLAITAWDAVFVPETLLDSDFAGLIPDECIAMPIMDDLESEGALYFAHRREPPFTLSKPVGGSR